ncbi:MAG: DUF1587 domain-containing protein, partial [Verrucomicrobia bacterium]|nr:DUF1587 domain-containing protein [Verrucomicrobiota bacterium]
MIAAGSLACAAAAANPHTPEWQTVLPSLQEKCFDCHGGKKTKGGVDLKRLETDPSTVQEYELWTKVRDALKSGDMPPEDSKPLPPAEREAFLRWVEASLDAAALANAGDPGPVTLRRLTNAEFDYSIRDLTGVPFQFAKDFVPDGGGGEGFSNIGDALFVSPQQLDKVFAAARKIADHATIMPGSGIRFSPQRVGVRSPAKFKSDAESVMSVWYQKASMALLPKDGEDLQVAKYITACWKWKHRAITGAVSLEALAAESQLTTPFLENWWNFLENARTESRFLDLTRNPWKALPAPEPNSSTVPALVSEEIKKIEAQLNSWFLPLKWPVLRAQQDADELKSYPLTTEIKGDLDAYGQRKVHIVVGDLGDGNRGDLILVDGLEINRKGKKESYIDWLSSRAKGDQAQLATLPNAPESAVRKTELQRRLDEANSFLSQLGRHPQGREISAKALALQAPTVLTLPLPADCNWLTATGKLDARNPDLEFASAQWMATTKPPPDPTKIIPGVITVCKRGTETHKKTNADFWKLYTAFSFNLEHRLNEVAANRFRAGKPGPGIYYFSDPQLSASLSKEDATRLKEMHDDWRFVANRNIPKALEPEWDKKVLDHLEKFAGKAWRRPLSPEEKIQLKKIYTDGISQELDRESAAREVIVHALVAPSFLYKLEDAGAPGIHPVSPLEL